MPGKAGLFWVTVQVAATILAINMGIRQTFGLFTVPVSGELGLGREVFSLSMALLNLVWGAAAPFAGAFADKYGARRVIFAGAASYVLGICLLASAGGQAALIAAGVLIGLVESLGGLLIDPSYKTLIVFGLYLAVVLVRPMGLFGRF